MLTLQTVRQTGVGLVAILTMAFAPIDQLPASEESFFESLRPKVREARVLAEKLPDERKKLLDEAAESIVQHLARTESAPLIFICTHNSRRSHLSQIWADVAASYYEVPGITTFSGGTATTACNPRTVRSLRRSGFSVVQTTAGENPIYLVQYSEAILPSSTFSKIYDHPDNPQTDFIAMMCCSDADENCPVVRGAVTRVALHYEDPKIADDTPREASQYDERSLQIASEMFYLMGKTRQLLITDQISEVSSD